MEEPEATDDGHAAEPEALCPNCMSANHPRAHFCVKCGAPLTSYAVIAPLERVYATGHVYRKATSKPGSFIVLLGMWLIFAPGIPFLLAFLFGKLGEMLASGGNGIVGRSSGWGEIAIIVTMLGGMLVLDVAILFKVTRNYLRAKKK